MKQLSNKYTWRVFGSGGRTWYTVLFRALAAHIDGYNGGFASLCRFGTVPTSSALSGTPGRFLVVCPLKAVYAGQQVQPAEFMLFFSRRM